MNSLIDTFLLVAGFIYTFLIPGFLVVENFFKNLPKTQKIPLYMILSLEISSILTYITGLVFGLNRLTIISLIIIWFSLLTLFLIKKSKIKIFNKTSAFILFLGILIYLTFFTALYRAIFYPNGNSFIMGADNWQDTAMHTSIIESITQGNFPPQAPYYSGYSLDYYYFVDFHSSILNILYGQFFPRILVFDNPFFVTMFFMSVFAACYSFTKNKLSSFFSSILATFYGNQMYTVFIKDVIKGGKPLELLARDGYALDFNGLYQVTPMVDYFLQNRPMMFGLPAFVINSLLIFDGFKKRDLKRIVLAGIIVGLSIKFQLFSFMASLLAFTVAIIVFLSKKNFKFILKSLFVFGLPIGYLVLISIFLFPGQSSLLEVFKNTFHWGPWESQNITWHLKFIFGNFGPALIVAVITFIFLIIKNGFRRKWIIFTFVIALILFSMPYLMNFTIFNRDMFKFFYVSQIPISILCGYGLSKIFKVNLVGKVVSIVIITVTIFTSCLVLVWSHESKTVGYSKSDYITGLWIRENTPQKSVFITYPTVHSPVSDIGGRLRVTSYINWPYSHGFNKGPDNVFARLADIDNLYRGANIKFVLNKYKVRYIYFGPEEESRYPGAEKLFENVDYLKIIYNSGNEKIYEVIN